VRGGMLLRRALRGAREQHLRPLSAVRLRKHAAPSDEGIRLQVLLQINQTAALAIFWHSDSSKRVGNTLCGYFQFILWYWSIPSSNRPVVALLALSVHGRSP